MRFSSVFHLPAVPQQPAAGEAAVAEDEAAPQSAPAEVVPGEGLPEDLDARVRLIGEWQLGESD